VRFHPAFAGNQSNRQVSVTDKSTNLLVAEYAYLASGERIAALKYSGGEVSDYTRYVREGGAVVWEKSDGTGHEKRYIYAGGRMAYTEEAWVTCALPKLASSPTQSLASLQVAPDANGQTINSGDTIPISKTFRAQSLPPGLPLRATSSPCQAAAEGQV
jgi:hypothetical protein